MAGFVNLSVDEILCIFFVSNDISAVVIERSEVQLVPVMFVCPINIINPSHGSGVVNDEVILTIVDEDFKALVKEVRHLVGAVLHEISIQLLVDYTAACGKVDSWLHIIAFEIGW